MLARQAAREQGAGEAILVDRDGMVTEGAATSFWIVDRDGVLLSRPLSHAILPGCTRAALESLMQRRGRRRSPGAPSARPRCARPREAFITSATSFVKPVVAIDGKPVGDGKVGPVTRRLFAMFARHVEGGLPNAA